MNGRGCHRVKLFALLLLPFALGALGACTTKATTDTTSDGVTNFLSSTTGRSWFTEDGLVLRDQKVQAFVHVNFDDLKQEVALGKGEYLTSFGQLLGVPARQQEDFASWVQARYPRIIPSERTTPGEFLAALDRERSNRMGSSPAAN